MLKNSTILVTGCSGFIGKHLLNELLTKGATVICVARNQANLTYTHPLSDRIEIIDGELQMSATLERLPTAVDAVIHLAAALGHWGADKTAMTQSNVDITGRLLDWFSTTRGRHFILASTPGVQGFGHKAAKESEPYAPRGIYEQSKVLAEKKVRAHRFKAGQHWTIVRPDLVYGPGDTRRVKLYRKIKNRQWIRIGSGTSALRPTYVEDACEALALCALDERAYGQTFNIAGPELVTADEFVDTIAKVLGVQCPPLRLPASVFMAVAEIFEWIARRSAKQPLFTKSQVEFLSEDHATDISKINETLGFVPRTTFIDGMRATLRWALDEKLL